MYNCYTQCIILHTVYNFTFIDNFELLGVTLRCFVAKQLLLRIYALSSVKFPGLKLRLCKKNDKYQVWFPWKNDMKVEIKMEFWILLNIRFFNRSMSTMSKHPFGVWRCVGGVCCGELPCADLSLDIHRSPWSFAFWVFLSFWVVQVFPIFFPEIFVVLVFFRLFRADLSLDIHRFPGPCTIRMNISSLLHSRSIDLRSKI